MCSGHDIGIDIEDIRPKISDEMQEKIRIVSKMPDAPEPLHTDKDVKRHFSGEK